MLTFRTTQIRYLLLSCISQVWSRTCQAIRRDT